MSVLSLSNVRSEGGLLPHGFDKPVDAVQDGTGRDVRGVPLLRHVLHGHAGVVYQAGHAGVRLHEGQGQSPIQTSRQLFGRE